MLKIRKSELDAIIAHARKEAPIEACGYLAERDDVVELSIPLTNTDKAAEHFSLDPKEQFAAVREIRGKGMKLKAVYHSHPATLARPSQEDIRLAHDPNVSYVIVSLCEEEPVAKSFLIREGTVQEEEMVIIN